MPATTEPERSKEAALAWSDELGCKPKSQLMVTVKMFDGPPYGEFTIEPGYKARGGEQELLREVVDAMKRWRDGT